MSESPPALGRSLRTGHCTVAELAGLTNKFAIARHYVHAEIATYAYDSVLVDGDLVIDGDLDTFRRGICRLVVTGSLRVSGLYRDHEDPATAVFVLGDFTAGRAITNGALAVAGNVTVHDALVGYYNDHSAELHGNVTTRVFVPENHFFSIHGKLAAEHIIGDGAQYRVPPKLKTAATPVDDRHVRQLVVDEILEIEDYGDPSEEPEINVAHQEVRKRVAANLPLLRSDVAQAPVVLSVTQPAAIDAPTPTKAKVATQAPAKTPAVKKPAGKKPVAKKRAVKKPAKKAPAKKAPAKKAPAKKAPAKKAPAKKAPAKKAPAKKPVRKQPAKKQPAKKQPARAKATKRR